MLSDEDRGFFARNGYVVARNAISESLCDYLRAQTWARLPLDWTESNPGSWTGEVTDSCHTGSLLNRRGHIKFQKDGLEADSHIQAGFGIGSPLAGAVGGLIGTELAEVYVRGLYCIIPTPGWETLRPHTQPHIEAHPMHVVAIAYLDDVDEREGALYLWPGTHRELYPTFKTRLDYFATDETEQVIQDYSRFLPQEVTGKRGDVILMHHRLLHAPSLNRSETRIRFSLFCDYRRADWQESAPKPPGDLWEDWPAMQDQPIAAHDFHYMPHGRYLRTAPEEVRTESTQRKMDASGIVRLRQEGDYWIQLSDCEGATASHKLAPMGSDLAAQGIAVLLNGEPVKSVSQHDVIAAVKPRPGANEIRITGAAHYLEMRLLQTALPLSNSTVLVRQKMRNMEHGQSICFEIPEIPARRVTEAVGAEAGA